MKLKLAGEPLVLRTAITAAVTAIVHVAVVLGYLPITEDEEQAVAAALDAAGLAVAVWWSRRAVTPVAKYEPRHAASEEEEPSAEEVAA